MKQRNYEIDFWKFVFSIVIVFLHSFNLFDGKNLYMVGGSIGVDFFFIVTGYYFANQINGVEYKKRNIGRSCLNYVVYRYKKILPSFIISCMIALTLRTYFSIDHGDIFFKLAYLINEILLLQSLGFPVYAVTGSAWYLSAMLISIAIIYPIIRYLKDIYIYI